MRSGIFIVCMMAWGSLSAQRNTVAGGGEASGSGGSASYSIGQLDFIHPQGSGGTVTQGVQQPYELFALLVEQASAFSAVLFPNPSRFGTWLVVGHPLTAGLRCAIFDASGKMVYTCPLFQPRTELPTTNLAGGTYFVNLYDDDHLLNTFRLIKNN